MAGEAVLKLTKEQQRAVFRRELLSKPMFVAFGIILTQPLWIPVLLYLFLRSFLFDPHGILAGLYIIAVSVFVIWAWGSFFVWVFRRSKALKPLRKATLKGDEEARQRYLELRQQPTAAPYHALGLSAFHLLIPVWAAIIIWSSTSAGEFGIRDHGKLRPTTREESLRMSIRALEREGIFSILNK